MDTEIRTARRRPRRARPENPDAVIAGAFDGNRASARVLDQLGFAATGRGESPCTAKGRVRPITTFRLRRADWEQAHG